MSLVITLLLNDFVVMSGDLRAVNADNHTQKINGLSKVFTLNDNVIYGLTGDLDVMIDLNQHLAQQTTNKTNVQATTRIICKYLRKRLSDNPGMQLRAHIAGVGDGNKITLIEIGYDDNFKQQKLTPQKQEAFWRMMYSNVSPQQTIADSFSKLSEYTPQSVSNLLQKVNRDIAAVDDFVSAECQVKEVIKN